jgi:hypothetical protein
LSPTVAVLALAVLAIPVSAQTIRGVTVDATTQLPIADVLVTLLDGTGRDLGVRTRSNATGSFLLLLKDPGRYRVMATRIGFQPLVSVLPSLKAADLASVRMPMTVLAQELAKMVTIERRHLTLTELMSPLGFDVRQAKAFGRYLDSAQLNAHQFDTMQNLIESHVYPNLAMMRIGPNSEPVVAMTGCGIRKPLRAPEAGWENVKVFLDGRLMNLESTMRIGSQAAIEGSIKAFSLIQTLPANTLYGVEIYGLNQGPPPSLGGRFDDRGCAIAVWTKAYAERVAMHEAERATPGLEARVVWGILLDAETHAPVTTAEVALQVGASRSLGGEASARTDSSGRFLLRTNVTLPLRIAVRRSGYLSVATATFTVDATEVVAVELAMSRAHKPTAPLTIIARDHPVSVALTSFAGFELRRQRTKTGVFLLQHEIAQRGAISILDLLGSVTGVTVRAAAGEPSVRFVSRAADNPAAAEGCVPAFVVDGARLDGTLAELVKATPVGSVRGVEIYLAAADVPPEFAKLAEGCGAVFIWKG